MNVLPDEYNFLIPLKSQSLNRFGINQDGGYILDEEILKLSNFLVSFGMANEFSFEEQFLDYNKKNKLIIFDYSVGHIQYQAEILKNIRRIIKLKRNLSDLIICLKNYYNFIKFINRNNVNFYSKKVANKINTNRDIKIKEIFEDVMKKNNKNITLKIDIEGSEYDIMDQILDYENIIDQIVIEYHDTHKRKKEFFENVKMIQKYFYINHLHANNYQQYNSDGFPINIEVSFSNNKYLDNSLKKNYIYPLDSIDFPNNPKLKDLKFQFKI